MNHKFVVPIEGTNIVKGGEAAAAHEGVATAPESIPARPASDGWREGIWTPQATTRTERSRYMAENGMGRTIARSMAARAEASAPGPSPAPAPEVSQAAPTADYAAMQAEIARLQQEVASFTANPYGGAQYGQDDQLYPEPELDPANYDLYDRIQRLQYKNAHDEYVKKQAARAVEADREARRNEANHEALLAEADALRRRYGRDANYSQLVEMALQECAAAATAGRPFNLIEAYKRASDEVEADSGRRGSSYLPQEVRGVKSLGAIMRYNQETGRAGKRPVKRTNRRD